MNAQQIKEILLSFSDDEKSKVLSRFFKTSKGAYGEGDCFIGVPVPIIRSIAKRYRKEVSLSEVEVLLDESIHECRMLGLLLMKLRFFEQSENQTRQAMFDSQIVQKSATSSSESPNIRHSCIDSSNNTSTSDKETTFLYRFAIDRIIGTRNSDETISFPISPFTCFKKST